jgi:hypothetical protein
MKCVKNQYPQNIKEKSCLVKNAVFTNNIRFLFG